LQAFLTLGAPCVNRIGDRHDARCGAARTQTAPEGAAKAGIFEFCALPRGNALFESLGHLLMNELEGKAVLEIPHHAGLHPAEHHQ
jgi:hypothetical protein